MKETFYVTPMVSDHAVLQRDEDIVIRGGGRPGARVRAVLLKESEIKEEAQGTIEPDGRWRLKLPPLSAGGPYELFIVSEEQKLKFSDIFIGDVWLLSGQSNMQLPMERVKYRYPEKYRKGSPFLFRQFCVPIEWNFKAPSDELSGGEWICPAPEAVSRFSAVGFFFAERLFQQYRVPVGIVLTAVGGTPIQAWMSREALRNFPDELDRAVQCRNDNYINTIQSQDASRIRKWWEELDLADPGIREHWEKERGKASWKQINLSQSWNGTLDLEAPGTVWLRKSVVIPEERARIPLRVSLGTITDADFTYVNGALVGNTTYRYPPREYELKGLLPGQTEIVVRVAAVHGQGGFTEGKKRRLIWQDGIQWDISEGWEYCRGALAEPLEEETFFERKPAGMYQGMVAPLEDFPIKGICWYQGEMNAEEYTVYPKYFKSMTEDLRRKWRREDLPVLFVQLPNYDLEDAKCWISFRDMQRGLTQLPYTGMAVTIDCGEANDLHPTNKKTVGERLAMAAFQIAYKEPGAWLSPVLSHIRRQEKELILSFEYAEEGLYTSDGKPPAGFFIILEESKTGNKYGRLCAKAQIKGKKVVLQCPAVSEGTRIRVEYACSNNPLDANLCNKRGLPASPFRSLVK